MVFVSLLDCLFLASLSVTATDYGTGVLQHAELLLLLM